MKIYYCKVCNKELVSISSSGTLFQCNREREDHEHTISLYDTNIGRLRGLNIYAEEIMVCNPNEDIGYLVNVDYEFKKTVFAKVRGHQFLYHKTHKIIFSLDDFDREKFIDRFEKLMVLM